jgi:hypothetical protein
MRFEVVLPQGEDGAAQPLPPDESAMMIEAAVARSVLSDEQAEALRSIQAALHGHDALGWFIERHCREFRDYSRDQEQKVREPDCQLPPTRLS